MDENTFINDNYRFIYNFSNSVKASLETDDKLAACMEGFLYSVRTYHDSMGSYRRYAEKCMLDYVRKEEKSLRNQRRSEYYNISLNMTSVDDEKNEFSSFIGIYNPDYASKTAFYETLSGLDNLKYRICKMLFYGYSIKEIEKRFNISPRTIKHELEKIRTLFTPFLSES